MKNLGEIKTIAFKKIRSVIFTQKTEGKTGDPIPSKMIFNFFL